MVHIDISLIIKEGIKTIGTVSSYIKAALIDYRIKVTYTIDWIHI